MRLIYLTLLVCLIFCFNSFSQSPLLQTQVSLRFKNVSLSEILNKISKDYQVNFSYVNDLIPTEKKITVKCRNQELSSVLKEILLKANLDYQQVGNQIVLKKIHHQIKSIKPTLFQTIRGSVIDKHSQELLPGATIFLLGEKEYKATTTDNYGKFRMEKVPVGRYDLKVTYIGYKENIVSDVIVNSGKEIVLSVFMEENIVEGEEITVYGQKDRALPNNDLIISSITNIRPESLTRFAGARMDPSRVVANYAGVINGRDPRNDIIVRGNSAYGLLWRMEGVDIPNPNHYTFIANSGGAFSILNNNLLASSDFISGAFPAEYGNKTSAVFDLKLRNGNNEKRENTFQVGLNGLELMTEGPIAKKGASYLASVRFFNFKILDELGMNVVPSGIPQFTDATFKINIPTKKNGSVSLWGIGGQSGISLEEADKQDTLKWGKAKYINNNSLYSAMYAVGGSYTHSFGRRFKGRLNISSSGSDIRYSNKEFYRNNIHNSTFTLKSKEGQNVINYSLFFNKNTSHHLKAGVTLKHLFFNNFDLALIPEDTLYISGLDHKGFSYFYQSFLHWQYKISPKVELNTGAFFQYFAFNKKWALEPRLAVRYKINEKHNVTLASGLHSQTQPLPYYQYKTPDSYYKFSDFNRKLGFTKSLHLVAGYNYAINSDWRLKAEAYYQYLYDVPVTLSKNYGSYSAINEGSEYSFSVFDSTVNKGTGKNYGIELTIEKFFSKKYYLLSTVTFLDSKYTGADGIERNTTFNIGHIFNILGGRVFDLDAQKRKQLHVDAKINFSGGRRYIEVDKERTNNDEDGNIYYDLNNAFQDKVRDYFRTDLKITYNINQPKATHNFFIALDNIFNTKNESSYDWDRIEGKVKPYYQLGIFPYAGYKIQF